MTTAALHVQWVLVPLFCQMTGYTDKAVRAKIDTGVWLEGRQYRRAPDGRITIDIQEYYKWVEGAKAAA